MFLEFFHLQQQPFGVTPNPAYLFPSQTHRDALYELSAGIQDDRGFLTLIAQPGMGKTTVLYQLLNELRDLARTAFIFQTQCDSRDFFGYLLSELGIQPEGMSLVSMHNRLNQVLFEEMLAGKRFVLVVDEAQNLDDSVLETIRLLSNFERENTKLLQIVLAGQPQLAEKLAQRQLAQLRQRIAVTCQLRPFNASETACYIEHRLSVAGSSGDPIFGQDALKLIAQLSGGVPRSINNICYSSLSAAHRRGQLTVNERLIREVAVRLGLAVSQPPITLSIDSSPKEMEPSDSTQPVLTILERIVSSLNVEAQAAKTAEVDASSREAGSEHVATEIGQAPAVPGANLRDSVPDFAWELEVPTEPLAKPVVAATHEVSAAIPKIEAPANAETVGLIGEVVNQIDSQSAVSHAPVSVAAPAEIQKPADRIEPAPAFTLHQDVSLEVRANPETLEAPLAAPVTNQFEPVMAAPVPFTADFEKNLPDAVKVASAPVETEGKSNWDGSPSPAEEYAKVFGNVAKTPPPATAVPPQTSKVTGASSTVPVPETPPAPQPVFSELKEPAAPEHEPVETDVFEAMSLASPEVISAITPAPSAFPPTVDEVLTPIVFESGIPQSPPSEAQEKEPAPLAAAAAAAGASSPTAKKSGVHPAAATAAAAWRAEMIRRQTSQPLTYKPRSQSVFRRWLFPTLGLAIVLFGGGYYLLPSVLKLARSWQETASASSGSSVSPASATDSGAASGADADSTAPAAKPENSEASDANSSYPADPQETSESQVVTVAVEPNESLQTICTLYVGHFDAQLLEQIRSLNPEMKDPDHLAAGQLIRIPLPPKTLKKVADSADSASPASAATPEKHPSLLNRFWGLLQPKK